MAEIKENIDSRNKIIKDDEIDLIEVAKTIWAGRKLILKVTAVFFVLGLVIAFGSKVEYEASCKLMPESQEGMKSNMGGLGSLAGLAGINLDMGGSGALTPELYPQIAKSTPFLFKVLNEPIHFEKQDTITSSYIYFKEIDKPSFLSTIIKYTVGLPFQVKTLIKPSDNDMIVTRVRENEIIRLSKEDTELLERFKNRFSVSVNPKSNIINISAEMPDAYASAELAQRSVILLTQFITDYKVSKAKENHEFIKARFDEVKIEFELSQEKLAIFNDRNRNVVTALAQSELQRLQNEYNFNFEIYKGLATQEEQAKIKIKEQTPVFTVLEPVSIPVKSSNFGKALTLFFGMMSGLILGIMYILLKMILQRTF